MPGVGDPAPNFSGTDVMTGNPISLSDYEGKVIFVWFTAMTCGPCWAFSPCVLAAIDELSGPVQFVIIHQARLDESDDHVRWVYAQAGYTCPVINEQDPYPIYSSYKNIGGLPETFTIGRDMVIKHIGGGADPSACSYLIGRIKDLVLVRDPIDVELVMDVSDSMNSPSYTDPWGDSKLTMLKRATSMILNFLYDHGQVDDRAGLVWFSDDFSEYENALGQKLIPLTYKQVPGLISQIETHETGTCTAMGAGLQTAFDALWATTQKPFIILCTDGMQNILPVVKEQAGHFQIIDMKIFACGPRSSVMARPGINIAGYLIPVHTVGIGVTAHYSALLQQIADDTGGFFKGTHDPENDLDLIYFLNMTNCMAGGSPGLIYHSIGTYWPRRSDTTEVFYVNRSVRKISVFLSWKRSVSGSLAFWLYAPDGTLIDLHQEMKTFCDNCMATIHLPRTINGNKIDSVGQWKVVIRGETGLTPADYHLFVIGEDTDIKYALDYPKGPHLVGDIMPIGVTLTENGKPILKMRDIRVEVSYNRVPITNLVSQYKISSYEIYKRLEIDPTGKYKRDPLLLKLEAMSLDHEYCAVLKPSKDLFALKDGSLNCSIGKKRITVPIHLDYPGLYSIKVSVHSESNGSGPICRTDMISVIVEAGDASLKESTVNAMEITATKLKNWLVSVTLRNSAGQMLGPGLGEGFTAVMGKKKLDFEIDDLLDGSYRMDLKEPRTKAKKRPLMQLLFRGKVIWNEPKRTR